MKPHENLGMAVYENGGSQVTTYREAKIGNHLFHVTSIFLGKIELSTALENLAISKILSNENKTAEDRANP